MRLTECYSLLNVRHGATLDEVKASYRKLAFKYHPDLNAADPTAAQHFTRVNEAYVILKKHLENAASSGQRTFDAETIRQEEEAKAQPKERRRAGAFYTKQEEVLKDILNDPFAKQVFEDIFSRLRRGQEPDLTPDKPVQGKSVELKWGERTINLNLGRGMVAAVRDWAGRQLDDHQTVHMPARNLIPGTTLRVDIKHRFSPDSKTIEVTLPADFVVGRPIRLKGLGRRLGPWKGDLYLRLLAR
jgi:molecular chaperone DnaJ